VLGSLIIFLASGSWRHETTAARREICPYKIQSCKSFNPENPDSDNLLQVVFWIEMKQGCGVVDLTPNPSPKERGLDPTTL